MASWIETPTPDENRVSSNIECSDDGFVIIASTYTNSSGGYIYSSDDSGASWTKHTSSPGVGYWIVTVSGDGSTFVAAEAINSGSVWTSSDAGATWVERTTAGTDSWVRVSCSDDGSIIYVSSETVLKKSTDGGATWSSISTVIASYGLDCSADGSVVVVGGSNGVFAGVIVSLNGGSSWTDCPIGSLYIFDVTVSRDGSTLFVTSQNSGGYPYLSTDDGSTWTQLITDPFPFGTATSTKPQISSDKLTLTFWHPSGIYASYDGGANWVWEETTKVSWSQYGLVNPAMSADGGILVAPYDGSSGGYHGWFTFAGTLPSAPSITSISPTSGPLAGGTNVNLIGTKLFQLSGGNDIIFGTESAGYGTEGGDWINYYVDSPAGIAAGPVTVTYDSSDGVADYDFFTYESDFSITSITPNTGSTAGGTPVTIVGVGFDPAATAAIDGNDLTDVTVVDSTTITGITPAGTAGVVDVTVTNP